MPEPKSFHYVYVLVSLNNADTHYTGITTDLHARLAKHNSGSCPHTSKYRPWRVETCTAFANKDKAVAFETYLKTGSGREFARRHF